MFEARGLAVFLALAVSACTRVPPEPNPGEVLALEAQLDSIEALFRSSAPMRDAMQGYVDFFEPDVVLRPPDQGPVVGRGAALEFYLAGFDGLEPISLDYDSARVVFDGDIAIRRYEGVARAVASATSDTLEFRTRYVDLLRRTQDGEWLISVHAWSPLDQ